MQVHAFIEQFDILKPDSVILNYFINDAEITPQHKGLPNIFARHSYAYNFFMGRWDTFLRMFFGSQNWEEYYATLYNSDSAMSGWDAVVSSVQLLKQYCEEKGLPLMLVNYPEIRQLKPYPFAYINEKIESLAQTNGIDYVDLLPALENENPANLWVTRPDPHPNAYADGLIADYLYKIISSPENKSVWLVH